MNGKQSLALILLLKCGKSNRFCLSKMKLVSWLRSESTLDEGKQEILIFVKLVVDAPVVLFYLGYSFTSHALSIC